MLRLILRSSTFLIVFIITTACLFASQVMGDAPVPLASLGTSTQAANVLATAISIPPTLNTEATQYLTVQAGRISGIVFFDRNADGLREADEPGIPSVKLCLGSAGGELCASSGDEGAYTLENITLGDHKLALDLPESAPANAFRFVNLFESWQEIPDYYASGVHVPAQRLAKTVLQSTEKTIPVRVEPDTRLEIGLSQGFLTDVFDCAGRAKITKFHGYDLDPATGSVRNYLGDTSPLNHTDQGPPGTEDNHHAVDWGGQFGNIVGTPVRAAAPGVVSFAGTYQTWQGTCLVVDVAHPGTDGNISGYVHLDKILVSDRQEVLRGQIIGTLGSSCTTWPHVHFFLRNSDNQAVDHWEGIDPFRDTLNPASLSWWTEDNQPVCMN